MSQLHLNNSTIYGDNNNNNNENSQFQYATTFGKYEESWMLR